MTLSTKRQELETRRNCPPVYRQAHASLVTRQEMEIISLLTRKCRKTLAKKRIFRGGSFEHMGRSWLTALPCNFNASKETKLSEGGRRWGCACDEMKKYKYYHCLLFVREDGKPITEYFPEDHRSTGWSQTQRRTKDASLARSDTSLAASQLPLNSISPAKDCHPSKYTPPLALGGEHQDSHNQACQNSPITLPS